MSKDSGSTSTLLPSETRSAGILEPRVSGGADPAHGAISFRIAYITSRSVLYQ